MAATTKPTFSTTKPTLFWNKVCPFVHKAWLVAVEKNVDLELQYIPLGGEKPAWYEAEVNPAGTVPSLLLPNGKLIRESNFVAQYLDENYGIKGSLQGGTPEQKYEVRRFVAACGAGVVGAMYGLLMTPDTAENKAKVLELTEKVQNGLRDLESRYDDQDNEGPYFLGSEFSMADVAILPFLDRFRYTLAAYRDVHIFDGCHGDFPRLKKMLAAAEARPSFGLTSQPGDFYVKCYKGYAKTEPVNTAVFQGTLYVADNCPFCQRVKLANVLKGSPFEVVKVNWDEDGCPNWSETKIPKYDGESVPVITYTKTNRKDGSTSLKILTESVELVQFVDEYSTGASGIGQVKGNTIQPADGVDAYETRFLISELGETMGDLWQAKDKANTEAGQSALMKLGYLESYYARQNNGKPVGPYFLGAKATMADCVALPFWATAEVLYEKVLATLPGAKGATFAAGFPTIAKSLAAARAEREFEGILPAKADIEKGFQ